jgi:hypothetical protein
MADQEIPAEALAVAEQRAQYAYADWSTMPNRDAYVHQFARRAARTAVLAAAPLLIEQGRRQALAEAAGADHRFPGPDEELTYCHDYGGDRGPEIWGPCEHDECSGSCEYIGACGCSCHRPAAGEEPAPADEVDHRCPSRYVRPDGTGTDRCVLWAGHPNVYQHRTFGSVESRRQWSHGHVPSNGFACVRAATHVCGRASHPGDHRELTSDELARRALAAASGNN